MNSLNLLMYSSLAPGRVLLDKFCKTFPTRMYCLCAVDVGGSEMWSWLE